MQLNPNIVNVMIDLETLSTSPNGAIVQIGVCRFNRTRIWSKHMWTVDPGSLLRAGFHVEGDTLGWWLRQSDAARQAVFPEHTIDILPALKALTSWWWLDVDPPEEPVGCNRGAGWQRVWSHGASFDVALLDSAYRRFGMKAPWDYRNVRDTRTLWELAGVTPFRPTPEDGPPHVAIADAVAQARTTQAAFDVLAAQAARAPAEGEGASTFGADGGADAERTGEPAAPGGVADVPGILRSDGGPAPSGGQPHDELAAQAVAPAV